MPLKQAEINNLLRSIVGQMRADLALPIQPRSVAPFIPSAPPSVELSKTQRPSIASRVIDVLSRPIYAVNEVLQTIGEAEQGQGLGESIGEAFQAAGRGITGKDKTLFSDVLGTYGMEKGAGRTALGFAGDVLLDPLTYAGGAGLFTKIGAGGRAIQKSQSALREVEDVATTGTREMISRAVNVNPQEVAQAQIAAMGKLAPEKPIPQPPNFRSLPEGLRQTLPTSYEFPRVQLPNLPELRTESGAAALRNPTIAVPEGLRGLPVEEALPKFLKYQRRGARELEFPKIAQSADPVVEAGVDEGVRLMAGRLSTKPMPALDIPTGRSISAETLAQSFLKKNKHKSINEAGQADLLQSVVNQANKEWADLAKSRGIKQPMSPAFRTGRHGMAFDMLRVAEEAIERAGRKFEIAGKPIRPSEIINEVGMNNLVRNKDWKAALSAFATGDLSGITNAALRQNLDEILKNRATLQADIVNKSMEAAVRRGEELGLNAVAARAKQNKDVLAEALGDLQRAAGAVAGDVKASKNFLKKILEPDDTLPLTAIQHQAVALMRKAAEGKSVTDTVLNKAVYDSLGGNPRILAKLIGNNRATEAIMSRFATWWGAKDLRPFQREALDTARIAAASFAEAWRPVIRAAGGKNAEPIVAAWKSAQGGLPPAGKLEADISQQFTNAMEKLLHGPGLSDDAARGNTVALRAGLTMDELNDALKATGAKQQFTNAAKVKDKFGRELDFSKNADWLKSWTAMDIDDPIEFMYRIHHALQRVTRKNAFYDDLVARWGYSKKTGDFTTKINHPRVKDFWFPKEISDQANSRAIKEMFDATNYTANSKLMQNYDKILSAFKSGVTIYSPSHHIRNLIGDLWLSGLDGAINPKNWMIASRVMASQRGRYTGLMGVADITDPLALKRAMTRSGDTVLTTRAGQQLTAEQVYTAAYNHGILLKASQLEDIIETKKALVPDILGGRVRQTAHHVSEVRDHFARLGHFVHVLRTSKTRNIDDLFREAGHRVKRFHPDGMDMTEFERKVMRRIIPFYSWLRKSTPLMIEALVQRPSLVTIYPKAMAELQQQFGIEPVAGMGDPFPADQMFPSWIRAKGIGPLGGPESLIADLARNKPPGYIMLNPSVPFNDAAADLSDPIRFLRSSITPVASVPLSLYAGKDPLGIPLESSKIGPISGPGAYVAQQVLPPLATGSRITGATRPDESWTPEQLIRWLTASGLIGTGPYKEQAAIEEAERRQRG